MNNKKKLGRGAFLYMIIFPIALIIGAILHVVGIKPLPKLTFPMLLQGFVLIMIFIIWNSVLTKGWKRTLLTLVLLFVIPFIAEVLGVTYGLVFGWYYYTDMLGPKVLGVPLLIGMAWEPILYSSFFVTEILLPVQGKKFYSLTQRIILYILVAFIGAIATTSWDMMMDPFAVNEGWWVWMYGGPYIPYIESGVPISNFLGWMGVAFVCHLVYRAIMDTKPEPRHSAHLSMYGPLALYIFLYIQAASLALLVLKHSEVWLIGLMCMGCISVMALIKVIFLQPEAESAGLIKES